MAFLVSCKHFCIVGLGFFFFPSYDSQKSRIYWKKRWAKWLKVPVLYEMDANSRRTVVMLLWEPAARSRTAWLSWLIMKLCEDAVVLSKLVVIHSCLCWALTELALLQQAASYIRDQPRTVGSWEQEACSGWVTCRTSGNCTETAGCGETPSLQGYLFNLY